MMNSRADKIRAFRRLQDPRMGESDLRLLVLRAPAHPGLGKFRRNPARYADDILYALIDVTTERDIAGNRQLADETREAAEAPPPAEAAGPTAPATPDQPTKKLQKEEEYPRIDWQNLADEDVQTATILYNDRINTHRRMKQLDEQLETAPTAQAVAEMAELRIRNLQAFAELEAFNDTGRFLCRHPLLHGRSEFAKLFVLLKADPAEFLRRHKNVLDNIRRYEGYLKRADRKGRRAADRESLRRHREREQRFRLVLEQVQQP